MLALGPYQSSSISPGARGGPVQPLTSKSPSPSYTQGPRPGWNSVHDGYYEVGYGAHEREQLQDVAESKSSSGVSGPPYDFPETESAPRWRSLTLLEPLTTENFMPKGQKARAAVPQAPAAGQREWLT